MTFSRVIIIYNPNSTGPSQHLAEELAQRLADYPSPVELRATQHAGHAAELAEAAARQYDRPLIVSSSGDGGYHEVVNGLMRAAAEGHPAIAGLLPAGNANDHYRTVAHAPLVERIISGRTTQIDLLKAVIKPSAGAGTVEYAHSYIGLGLTPVVATELNRHTLNALRELLIVIRTFSRFQPVAIRSSGQVQKLDSLILSNIKHMAKALTLSQSGQPDDGRFEVTAFPASSKFRLLLRLIRSATHGLRAGERTQQYAFETLKPASMQLDGEVMELAAGTQVAVTIAPQALETVI